MKSELINMTWAWDKKIWVPDRNWTHDPPGAAGDFPPGVQDVMGSIPVGDSHFFFVPLLMSFWSVHISYCFFYQMSSNFILQSCLDYYILTDCWQNTRHFKDFKVIPKNFIVYPYCAFISLVHAHECIHVHSIKGFSPS